MTGYESVAVMQNSHKELWALLNWANPGSLGDWTSFERHYVEPLKLGQKKDCTDIQLAKVLTGLCNVSKGAFDTVILSLH